MARYLLSATLLLALAVTTASADFRAVRSIPVPEGPGSLRGLDTDGNVLFAVAHQGDCTSMCSYLYLLDPLDGTVLREDYSFNYPPHCGDNASLLISGACCGNDVYWVGDECGDAVKIKWTADSLNIRESFLSEGGEGQRNPRGLVYRDPNVYLLDASYLEILTYDDDSNTEVSEIPLPSNIPYYPSSITFYGDSFLISSAGSDSVFEVNADGELVASHWLEGLGERTAVGITMLDGQLYVASFSDSIMVFEPDSYEEPVPEGDSIVVEVVPDGVTVGFDSVSAAGTITADVSSSDSCPPPEGVSFFDVFTEIATDANFDYAAEVVLATQDALPPGVEQDLVRVFVRPSGACQAYRDITVEYTELPSALTRLLSSLTRTISEDYEFSVFALGEDTRRPRAVVDLKFDNLEGAIDAGAGSIPPTTLSAINGLLDSGRSAYYHGLSRAAAVLVDSIAAVVRATPAIPHTYDPDTPGSNLAGHLISDAHTLAFSLGFSADQAIPTQVAMAPECINFSYDGWVRAVVEIPPGRDAEAIDSTHVFLMHAVQAVPDSLAVGDYDGDGHDELRAMFRRSQVKAALTGFPGGPKRITCFMDGYEVYADASVHMLVVTEEGPKGETVRLASGIPDQPAIFSVKPNPSASSVTIEFSSDGSGADAVSIYSVKGELVRTLAPQGRDSGTVSVTWEGDNQQGTRVAPGTYFVVASGPGGTRVSKLVLKR
ncbi:MAG: DUF6689 family protein [bacterium]